MHILVHDYAGHPYSVQLARTLAGRGHRVTHAHASNLVTPRGALEHRDADPDGLDLVEVSMSDGYRADKYNFIKRRGYEIAYGAELGRLVERIKPDVVVSGNTPSEPQWEFVKAARTTDIPFVSWVQDFYSLAVTRLASKKLPIIGAAAGAYYRWLDARCLRASAGVIAISEDFRPLLERFGVASRRISVVPNWAPLDEIGPQPKCNPWSTRMGLDEKFVFLYSGTLAMKHNPDLMRQLAVAFRDDPSVMVVVISEGPGADYLAAAKNKEGLDNLRLLPFQSFSDMANVLASGDVVVSVLEREAGQYSVPSKVLTYHAAGRPILGAMPADNLAARIIQEQGSGICVDPDDAAAFIDAARTLRTAQSVREGMAGKARRYATERFDIEGIASRFESIFEAAATHAA